MQIAMEARQIPARHLLDWLLCWFPKAFSVPEFVCIKSDEKQQIIKTEFEMFRIGTLFAFFCSHTEHFKNYRL